MAFSADAPDGLTKLKDLGIEDLLNVKAVSAVRHEQRQLDSPRSMSVITGEELRRRNFRTVPEALQEIVGVMVQETNYAGGSPIIRGMVGNRILILVDGIPVNSGSFRLGPNQYLNTIDISQVERIEIVRGAGSVLYGSDALGGLIQVITKAPDPVEMGHAVSGELFTRFSTADRGVSGRAQFSGYWKTLSVTGGFSGRHFGDLRSGGGAVADRSGYEERDGDARAAWAPSDRQRLTLSLARVSQSGTCRTDVMQSGVNLEYCWDPQQRDLVSLEHRIERPGRLADWLEVRAYYQTQAERLHTITAAKPLEQSRYFDRSNTHGVAMELGSRAGSRQLLTYGLDLHRDGMTSSRQDVNLVTGIGQGLPGNVPNGSTYGSLAFFLQDEVEVFGPVSLNLGGRYTRIMMRGQLTDPRTGGLSIDNDLHHFTGSAFLSLKTGPHARFLFGVAQGFRAPNLNDEGFLGISGTRFEIPNPRLKPEENTTYEAGFKYGGRRFGATASYFLAEYRGLIDRAVSTYAGLSFIDLNGNGKADSGEPKVYQRQNLVQARVLGGAVEGEWHLLASTSLMANCAWQRGDDTVNRTPLTRIPPVKGTFGSRWRGAGGAWLEGAAILSGAQRRLSPSDRADTRIYPGGTAGFATFNLRGGRPVKGLGELSVSLENISDRRYRWHGSGFDAPGINLSVGIRRVFP